MDIVKNPHLFDDGTFSWLASPLEMRNIRHYSLDQDNKWPTKNHINTSSIVRNLPRRRSRWVARYAILSSRNCLSIFLLALRCFFSSSVIPPFLKHPIAHKCDSGTREDTPVVLWNKKLLFFRRRGSKIVKLKNSRFSGELVKFLTHPGLVPLRHHGIHDRDHH